MHRERIRSQTMAFMARKENIVNRHPNGLTSLTSTANADYSPFAVSSHTRSRGAHVQSLAHAG